MLQVQRTARRLAGLLRWAVALSSLACGGGDAGNVLGPPLPPGFDATGDWTYSERLSDRAHGITCSNHGILHLAQADSTLHGTVFQNASCAGPGGTASDTATLDISSGTLTGSELTLTVDVCAYTGTLYAGTVVQGKGDVSCTMDLGGGTISHLTGTWQAAFTGASNATHR